MATSSRAPKQWSLTDDETLNSYNNWKANLIYTLSLDKNFTRFLKDGVTWLKESTADANRGLTDDATTVTDAKTKEEKVIYLGLMLGQIANYATIISRNTIVERSTSLNFIWSQIREYYGFQVTGSRFLDLSSIKLTTG